MKSLLKLLRTLFLRWVKFLPPYLGGPLLWGWLYGAPRLPSWSFRRGVNPAGGLRRPSGLTPRLGKPPTRAALLEDQEWFSLDTAFPVEGVEPFQELGLDYFMQQQDDNLELQQSSHTEEDYLYGTLPGHYEEEDDPGFVEKDIFYKLETREQSYPRDDHPGFEEVEFFDPHRHSPLGLGRITTPGEGPTAFNRGDNPAGFEGYYPQWAGWADWYLFRSSPTRITADFNWPESFYYYLLYENRHTWGGDPTGEDSTLWARNARGWPVWLFRRNSRSWGSGRWRVHKEWVKRRRYNWWSKPWIKTYKFLPNGFRRRYKRFRYWYRLRELEFNPRSNRWSAPFSGRTPNPMAEPDEWGYFQNTRFLESSFFYRRRRLRERYQKLNQGLRSRWRPRRGWFPRFGYTRRRGLFNPRWWFTPRVGRPRPQRARIAPWVAPRWAPAVERTPREGLPPTGVVPGVLLLAGWLSFWVFWQNRYLPWELTNFSFFFDVPPPGGVWPDPLEEWSPGTGWSYWQRYTTTGSFGGDYLRKVTLGIPNEWDLLRGGSPRERHSNRIFGDGHYSLTWGGRWRYVDPVGLRWWSHPGQGTNLLGHSFRNATYSGYLMWDYLLTDGDWYTQQLFGWNAGDVANLTERHIYFPYMDVFIPSWAHAHDVIGDAWVVFRGFRTWVDEGQEPNTVRRIIDHRYNRLIDTSDWLHRRFSKRFYPTLTMALLLRGEVVYQIQELQRASFLPPEWVSPPNSLDGGVPQWEIAYLEAWEKVTSTQLWPSTRFIRRSYVGHSFYDQTHSIDSRPLSRSEGFFYLGLPSLWEVPLNRELLHQWSQQPDLVDPLTPQPWFDSRISLLLSRVPPWWEYLVNYFFTPVGAICFYLGGALLVGTPTRGESPAGVGVTPVERYSSSNPPPRGVRFPRGVSPGGATGLASLREGRHLRRFGRFPARGDYSHRGWRPPATWRWTQEEFWSTHRLGFSRQAPRVGRRSARVHSFRPPRPGGRLVSSPHRGGVSHPGGGVGYSFTRFTPARGAPPRGGLQLSGKVYFPPHRGGSASGWLWQGGVHPARVDPPGEVTYPARGRRRRPRGDDRLLTREGTWSPHRRSEPTRGDYSSEVYSPTPGGAPGGLLPGVGAPQIWRLPPTWFTRSTQREWHLTRYRGSISPRPGGLLPEVGGLTQLGLTYLVGGANFPGATLVHPVDPLPGYSTEFYSDEYFDLVDDGHQVDDGYEEHHLDPLGEDYLGFRYLGGWTPPALGGSTPVGSRLVSYHRGETLPRGSYRSVPTGGTGNPTWGGPLWGSLGVDHPAAGTALLGGYEVPRLYRRLQRRSPPSRTTSLDEGGLRRRGPRRQRIGWVEPFGLITSPGGLQDELYRLGWSTREGDLGFRVDDLDCLEFGRSSLHGGGYSWGGPAGLTHLQHRPLHGGGRVWGLPTGLNGWRYLVGEDVIHPSRPDPEGILLEGLTTAYTDNYEEDAEAELGMAFDRDPEDEYFDAQNFEELDAEIPRPRVVDFPAWVLEEAFGGASPGGLHPEGMYSRLGGANFAVPDGGDPGFRSSRRELRRHYRVGRIKVSRWRRQQDPLRFPRRVGRVNDHLREVSPGGPDEQPLDHQETETLTGVVLENLEGEDDDELELRLWALTEIYYGDYPTGTFIDS